jgi:hypothetical protein
MYSHADAGSGWTIGSTGELVVSTLLRLPSPSAPAQYSRSWRALTYRPGASDERAAECRVWAVPTRPASGGTTPGGLPEQRTPRSTQEARRVPYVDAFRGNRPLLVLSSRRHSAALQAAWCRSRASSAKTPVDLTMITNDGSKALSARTTVTPCAGGWTPTLRGSIGPGSSASRCDQ